MEDETLQEQNNNQFDQSPTTSSQRDTVQEAPKLNIRPKPQKGGNTYNYYYGDNQPPQTYNSNGGQVLNIRGRQKAPEIINSETAQGNSSIYRSSAGDSVYLQQNTAIVNPFASDYFNAKWMGIDFGQVTDKFENIRQKGGGHGVNPFANNIDIELERRNAQSNAGAGINMLTQFLGKTAINTVGGIIGGFYSLGAAAVQGVKNLGIEDSEQPSATTLLFDNSVNRFLDKGTKAIEEGNSVFTSQQARKDLGIFSFETVKDVNDGLSFVAGAVSSELIMSGLSGGTSLGTLPSRVFAKAGNLMSKAAAITSKSIGVGDDIRKYGNYITRTQEIAKALKAVDGITDAAQKERQLQALAQQFGSSVDDLMKYKRSTDYVNSLGNNARRMVTGTFWEAGLEARQAKDDFEYNANAALESRIEKEGLNEEQIAEERQKIKTLSESAGLATFGLNVGVLSASNAIQFPTIFGPRGAVNSNAMAGSLTRKSLTEYIKKGGKTTDVLRMVGSALKSPITEFTEETLQRAISTGSKSYYDIMLGTRSSDGELAPSMSAVGESIVKGLKDAYGTEEGRHEGIVGAIIGAMGIPMFRRNKQGKLRVQVEGGIAESIRDYKSRNKEIEEAIAMQGLNNYGDLLRNNKDNAIIASMDAKRGDLYAVNNEQFELQDLRDNALYRHVKERMDKGLKSYLLEDIKDMQDMSLEDYKKTFNREETLTQEEKNKEVNEFEKKSNIYMEAYDKVYNGLKMNKMNNNAMTKKHFDILTYAVATEKATREKQLELTNDILLNPNTKLNKTELIKFAKLSDQFKAYEKEIEDAIKEEKDTLEGKFQAKRDEIMSGIENIKEHLNAESYSLLEELMTGDINDVTGYLNSIIKIKDQLASQEYKALAEDADVIFNLQGNIAEIQKQVTALDKQKDKMTTVNKGKFGKIRSITERKGEVLDKINRETEENQESSFKALTEKGADKLVQKDLEEFLELKARVLADYGDAMQEEGYVSMLDEEAINIFEKLDELSNITKKQISALQVAAALSGVENATRSYSRIVNASFAADLDNIKKQYIHGMLALNTRADDDYMVEILGSLSSAIKNVETDLEEFKGSLKDEAIDAIEKELSIAKEVKSSIEKELALDDKKVANAEAENKKMDEDELQQASESILNRDKKEKDHKKEVDDEASGKPKGKEFDPNSEDVSKNLHTIKLINPKNPDTIKLQEHINGYKEDGTKVETIDYNSAAIAEYSDSNEDAGFEKYLQDKDKETPGLKDSYYAGKAKVAKDITELEKDFSEMDEDVKNFIIHSPVMLSFYKSKVALFGKKQMIELKEDEKPIHTIKYFSPVLESDSKESLDKYNQAKTKEEQRVKEESDRISKEFNHNKSRTGLEGVSIGASIADVEAKFGVANKENTKTDSRTNDITISYPEKGLTIIFKASEGLLVGEIKHKIGEKEDIAMSSTSAYEIRNKQLALLKDKSNVILSDLEKKYESQLSNLNDMSLFKIRTALLKNAFEESKDDEKKSGKLEMRVGNILNGYLEKSYDTKYDTTENSLVGEKGLVKTIDDLTPSMIMYGNQSGEYVDLNDKVVKLNEGSAYRKTGALNSRVYLKYTTENGQYIPIMINRGTLGNNEEVFNEIMHQIKQYLKNKNPNEIITLNNTKLSFLNGKTYTQFFESFFGVNRSEKRADGTLATLNIRNDDKALSIGNFVKDLTSVEEFVELNKNGEIDAAIRKQRFFLSAKSLLKEDGTFNKEFFKFIIDNKLINHSFNADKNRDRVFVKEDNFQKGIQLHALNTEFKVSKKEKVTVSEAATLYAKIFGNEGNKNVSLSNLVYNLNKEIIAKMNKMAITRKSDDVTKLIKEAMASVITEKESQLLELAELRPDLYTEGVKEKYKSPKTTIKSLSNVDTVKLVDSGLRMLYAYENDVVNNEKAVDAFAEYLKSAGYEETLKTIMLEKGKGRVGFIKDTKEVVVREGKESFNFAPSESLMSSGLEAGEIVERYENILDSLEMLAEVVKAYKPLLDKKYPFNRSNKESDTRKELLNKMGIFFNFNKKYINKGKIESESISLNYDNKTGRTTTLEKGAYLGAGKMIYQNSLVYAEYFDKQTKTKKTIEPISFYIQNESGDLVKATRDEFVYDENTGELLNGVVFLKTSYISGDDVKASDSIVLAGSENTLNKNNYISSIQNPMLNSDFSLDKDNYDKLMSAIAKEANKMSDINIQTNDKFRVHDKVKKPIKEIKDDGSIESATEDELGAELLANVNGNKNKKVTKKSEKKEDNYDKKSKDTSDKSGIVGDVFDIDVLDGEAKDISSKSSKKTTGKVSNIERFEEESTRSNYKMMFNRMLRTGNTKSNVNKLSELGINSYEDFVQVIGILYDDTTGDFKKMITFAKDIFNAKDKGTLIINC